MCDDQYILFLAAWLFTDVSDLLSEPLEVGLKSLGVLRYGILVSAVKFGTIAAVFH